MVWDILESLALVAIVAGGVWLFGPWALIAGGVVVLVLSWLVNRRGGDGA